MDVSYHLVFVTAHHDFALDAFDTHAVDFLTKPARPGAVARCIDKILRQEVLAREWISDEAFTKQPLVLIDSGVRRIVDRDHILLVGVVGRYRGIRLTRAGTEAHGQNTLISDISIDELMRQLSDGCFLRVHRSYIVNRSCIIALRLKKRRHFLELLGYDEDIPVARSQVKAVKLAMEH